MESKTNLGDLPVAPRYFWADLGAFLRLAFDPGIYDRNFDGTNNQRLTPNRVLTLALNELSAYFRRGWFWHLPNRNSSSHEKSEPASRRPSKPCALYPAMLYKDFTWSEAARTSYFASSHQFRLVSSDFHLNFQRSPGNTPLHSFQVISDKKYPAYAVPANSHVILMTQLSLYLVPITDYERIVGRWPINKPPPTSADPGLRLDNVRPLWQGDDRDARCQALEHYKVSSLEGLYWNIMGSCAPNANPSLVLSQVHHSFPRPISPEVGTSFGAPLAAARPSRRGKRKGTTEGDESAPSGERQGIDRFAV
ncbi:hypothetical protein SLS60_007537 [Paraconiothyrium brasiliense]|uniref:Uncharacterized protein n=1 Tax=Paraconiothyrium brasiliense TaxID=300254 RepID=A0ABR3R636_9PLEO